METMVMQQKQSNGRYQDVGRVVTDPGYVYQALAKHLYRHMKGNRHCRIQSKPIDENTMRVTVTFGRSGYREVFTVKNWGSI